MTRLLELPVFFQLGIAMISVLQIVPSLAADSGVTRFVLNLNRYMDHDRFHFDYFHHSVKDGKLLFPASLDDQLRAAGSEVYTVSHGKFSPLRFAREASSVLEEVGGKYDVAHCHVPNNAFVTLEACCRAGVKARIMHSHLNSSSDNALHRARNAPLIAMGKRYANAYCACSKEAGRYLFGDSPFEIVNNGICLEDFSYSVTARNELRVELDVPGDMPVVGCVGRFAAQKNYPFAIDVFAEYVRREGDARLVMLGDGDERPLIESRIESHGLRDKVILAGIRDDVSRFYSLFDVFFMPSLYEGLPISAVEAQASGLPCLFSTGVPKESDILGKGTFLSLDEPVACWADALARTTRSGRVAAPDAKLANAGYSAKASAERLMELYEGLVGGR